MLTACVSVRPAVAPSLFLRDDGHAGRGVFKALLVQGCRLDLDLYQLFEV